MKRQFTLGEKVGACCGSLACVALLAAGSLLAITNRLAGEMESALQGPAKKLALLTELIVRVDAQRIAGRNALLYAYSKKPDIIEQEIGKFDRAEKERAEIAQAVRGLLTTDTEIASFRDLETNLGKWTEITRKGFVLCRQGKALEASDFSQREGRPFAVGADKPKMQLVDSQRTALEAAVAEATIARSRGQWLSTICLAMLAIVGVFVWSAMRRANSNLRDAVGELAAGAQEMSSAASQISTGSQVLARIASEQAASIEETAASAEEMDSTSRKSSDHVAQAVAVVGAVDEHVQQGKRAVSTMTAAMEEIGSASEKISGIIRVIDEIAFQTNILALNAAIEAARAGTEGLGFAVVAGEVRTLAQRSAEAAQDTGALVGEALAKSVSGLECVKQLAAVFEQISQSTGNLKILTGEVRAGSEEQTRGMAQIASAISKIDRGLQSTSANAQESAAVSQEMSAQTEGLKQTTARLASMIGTTVAL